MEFNENTLAAIGQAYDAFDQWADKLAQEFVALRTKAKKAGDDPPREDHHLPRCSNVAHLRRVAELLEERGVPDYVSEELLAEVGTRLSVRWALQKFTDRVRYPEFDLLRGHRIVVRWSRRAVIKRDGVHTTAEPGKIAPVPVADRLAWTGDDAPPAFVLTLSMPWFLLADADDVEWALHGLLMGVTIAEGLKPARRKPDVVAHAATLGRYGLRGWREAAAVAHAMAHADTAKRLAEFGFDPSTGQGLLWSTAAPARQLDIVDEPATPSRREHRAAQAGA